MHIFDYVNLHFYVKLKGLHWFQQLILGHCIDESDEVYCEQSSQSMRVQAVCLFD